MAAPRATQFIALRNLARNGSHQQQVRSLHMTGPATYASPVLTRERSILNLPRDIAGLRAECKRRKLDSAGSKHDLITRLNADELAHHRAFSTAAAAAAASNNARPTVASTAGTTTTPPTRHFNTSRALKAVNDSSTIDFAYLPTEAELAGPNGAAAFDTVRVPIIPTTLSSRPASSLPGAAADLATDAEVVMKPEISTMSADRVASIAPLAELSDCHAMHVDFHAVAEDVAAPLQPRGTSSTEAEGDGVFGRILFDMFQDLIQGGRKVAI